MNRRIQLVCAWCGPVFLVLFAIGLVPLAGFLPPPAANDTPQQVVRLYTEHHTRVQAGLSLMLVSTAFIAPWVAVISTQLRRIRVEGITTLVYGQLVAGGAFIFVVVAPVITMIVASYRPERNPEITQALNDLAWIPFIMVFTTLMAQMLVVAGAAFLDRAEEVFPRWVGHVSAWCAVLLLPAVLLPFYKDGPFAWNGIFQFWLAAVLFFGWFAVMSVALFRAIRSEPAGPASLPPLRRLGGSAARRDGVPLRYCAAMNDDSEFPARQWPEVPLWTENYCYVCYDPVAEIGVWTHLGRAPFDPTLWRELSMVFLPTGERLVNKGYGRSETDRGPGGATLSFECIEPWQQWRSRPRRRRHPHDGQGARLRDAVRPGPRAGRLRPELDHLEPGVGLGRGGGRPRLGQAPLRAAGEGAGHGDGRRPGRSPSTEPVCGTTPAGRATSALSSATSGRGPASRAAGPSWCCRSTSTGSP